MFHCMQKPKFITSNFFLRFCKDIANLLFWKLWECFTICIKNYSIDMLKTFMLICMQKNQLHHSLLSKILQRNSRLVILANLIMLGHTHKIIVSMWRNLLYLSKGKKLTPSFMFSLRYCKDIENLLILGTLGMPGYTPPKWYYQLVQEHGPKSRNISDLKEPLFYL